MEMNFPCLGGHSSATDTQCHVRGEYVHRRGYFKFLTKCKIPSSTAPRMWYSNLEQLHNYHGSRESFKERWHLELYCEKGIGQAAILISIIDMAVGELVINVEPASAAQTSSFNWYGQSQCQFIKVNEWAEPHMYAKQGVGQSLFAILCQHLPPPVLPGRNPSGHLYKEWEGRSLKLSGGKDCGKVHRK